MSLPEPFTVEKFAPGCFEASGEITVSGKRIAFPLIYSSMTAEGFYAVGADTVVYFNGKILGKPKDDTDAENMLKMLSGKEHTVITGYAVISDKAQIFGYDKSTVLFNELSEQLIKEYVATGKPLDKAGSYGVQDGFGLVRAVSGSVYNVIGLPIEKIKPILDACGK